MRGVDKVQPTGLVAYKAVLQQVRMAQWVNARIKSWQVKRAYRSLCKHYQTPSVLTAPIAAAEWGRRLWDEAPAPGHKGSGETRPRLLYIGTDEEQDRSGILQALSALAEVSVFEHEPGQYGQRWPLSLSEFEAVRRHNSNRLRQCLEGLQPAGPIHAIIGQMWGFSMHWRALAEARTQGIAVVNISMDDRHAFRGKRLADGAWGGTAGLMGSLTLAGTAAPECVAWYQKEGCPAIFLPEASDPDIFRPMPGPKLYDVCFVGAHYGIRAQMVRALDRAGIRVQVFGSGWPHGRLPGNRMPELFARSKIVLGCGTIGYCTDFFALKMRDFDGPMSGSLYLTHDNPDLQGLFENGREIVTFKDIPDMVTKVRYYLGHAAEREAIAERGRARAVRDHTWTQRFRRMFDTLGLTGER
jgi:spore maturation protein CgeB